eukprot:TRINITY_DN13643_c0_g1_i11.p1 TRINITY_DN13643_c0_g1~~TRINITY_DN13643_c0_g1_i11.p1  ORF type:complete len:209 (+),score=-8.53 TRINITY_DN13643_c0_g1_i11:924-1550(+)
MVLLQGTDRYQTPTQGGQICISLLYQLLYLVPRSLYQAGLQLVPVYYLLLQSYLFHSYAFLGSFSSAQQVTIQQFYQGFLRSIAIKPQHAARYRNQHHLEKFCYEIQWVSTTFLNCFSTLIRGQYDEIHELRFMSPTVPPSIIVLKDKTPSRIMLFTNYQNKSRWRNHLCHFIPLANHSTAQQSNNSGGIFNTFAFLLSAFGGNQVTL